jgi:uncharacterized protein YciI
MLFAVYCLDGPGALPKRREVYDAHRAHLETAAQYGANLVISGPLVADDGETPLGSFFLIEADSRSAAEAFNRADPFHKNGIWKDIKINAFLRRRG